ncbi:cyclohexanecarboxylate-CoA ligase [Scopulibacillus darangshiensis]|uniref:Cyclohexanecarboxylate-CoA ligase n=1 Tax=Scopulibacillus darangshiensis TaxID=442528 RepID=A0A4R2P4A5_9BACL|nr:class I adenylate-forming enzyme family protein [Scopulibacillus darangshiensis]TCP28761.1 cyclohexanecarboxylate-CoA ligase [Scopulibacillus darangshiensis]
MFEFGGKTLTEERALQFIEKGMWTNESFVDVLERDAKLYPEVVHKDEERSLTYKEMWEEVESVAANLYEMGIRKGDTVALQMPNTLDYVIAIFGAARIGAIGVFLQVDLGREALIQSLKQVDAKAWIVADYYRGQPLYDAAIAIQKDIKSLTHVILQGTDSLKNNDIKTFTSLRRSGKTLSKELLDENKPKPLDAFVMVFTSGTTGSPKGIVHLHANYLWSSRSLVDNFGYEPGCGVLDLAPISHQTGMLAGVMMTIATGGRILLLDRFSANRALKWVENEKPNFIIGAPPHVIHIANSPNLKSSDTSSVKVFIYAGAPVPSTVLQRLQTDGGIKVGGMFGWSEGFVATANQPDDPIDAVSSTVGFGLKDIEIRLVDEEGCDVKQGEPGELWSRGPNFCAGYYKNEKAANRQWDDEGWFHSGDLLRQDENGRYSFIARADDVINRGGTKIDPKSVEDVIAGHDAVERVAVVGAPHETLGQQTVACIVLKEGTERFGLPELRHFLSEHGLAKFQFPDRLEFLSELPMTHSGKIKNRDLRDRFRQGA